MRFFPNINKRTIFLSLVAASVLFVASFGMWVKPANAMLGFGGRIVFVKLCPCSANLAIWVFGPRGGVYTFQPGVSVPFANYQFWRPGPAILGTFVPGGVCLTGFFCAGFPTMGTMVTVGTSW